MSKRISSSCSKDPKYDIKEVSKSLALVVYKYFDKTFSGSGIKNENISNKELAEELHKIFGSYFGSLIFIINMIGLFLWKIKKLLQLLMLFKKS